MIKSSELFLDKIKLAFKWFYPGIKIKRWVGLSVFGFILLITGLNYLRSEDFVVNIGLDLIVVISGFIILILGIKHLFRSLLGSFAPSSRDSELVDVLYQRRLLSKGPKIVTVGGGTGLSVLLSGLKEFTSNITAVVTVADDGGSSGRIREQFDILPPGDIRNCLVALADAPALMRDLFQFRFDSGSELSGHSFGNLFITVMTRLTGDFYKAIKETGKVLALRGQVIPATLDNIALVAEYTDGSVTKGEDKIPKSGKLINKVYLEPAKPQATLEALTAIDEADIIVLGPGSLFTSIIPNLLINDISEKISTSSATKIYVCNIMTQLGETDKFSAADHVKALTRHALPRVFDYCIINSGKVPDELIMRYKQEDASPVLNDADNIRKMGYRVIEDNIMLTEEVVRHNPQKLASLIMGIASESRF